MTYSELSCREDQAGASQRPSPLLTPLTPPVAVSALVPPMHTVMVLLVLLLKKLASHTTGVPVLCQLLHPSHLTLNLVGVPPMSCASTCDQEAQGQ